MTKSKLSQDFVAISDVRAERVNFSAIKHMFCTFFISPTCAYYEKDPNSTLKQILGQGFEQTLSNHPLGVGSAPLGGEFFWDCVAPSWV